MITEDYVSFETAKLLKERGFDEHCFCINYPLSEGGHHNIILSNLLNNSMIPFTDEYKFCRYKEDLITIPTLQMAMKWLREIHQLCILPTLSSECRHTYAIYRLHSNYPIELRLSEEFGESYNKQEPACEAAINYCLEHLI